MNQRGAHNPFGGASMSVDKRLGNSFPIVEAVYRQLQHIKYLAENLNELRPKDIELQENVANKTLDWRYIEKDGTKGPWQVLLPLIDITGQSPEIRVSADAHIQWKYTNEPDSAWRNIFDLSGYLDQISQNKQAIDALHSSAGAGLIGYRRPNGQVQTVAAILDNQLYVDSFFIAGEADWSGAVIRAVAEAKRLKGATINLPKGVIKISQTIIVDSPYILIRGYGGAIDGNQPFQDTWDNIVANAGSTLQWVGATTPSFMLVISPKDEPGLKAAPLQGGGIEGVMFDCNNRATHGVKILATRGAKYVNSSVVRHTQLGLVLGVTTHDLYDGGSGTNTSISLCEFDNFCVSTAMLPGNTAKSVLMFGNGLKGGVNQCIFYNCQWFNSDYQSRHVDIENSDDNTFFNCRWNGTIALHASDTGTNPVSADYPGSLAQNHFFYACVGRMEVLTTIQPKSLTNHPSFGHGAWCRSGNLPGFSVRQQVVVGAGADISIYGDTLDFANADGCMTWGTQPAHTNCYLSSGITVQSGVPQTVVWSGSQYDRLEAFDEAGKMLIVVPPNVKWASATLNGSWQSNGTGQRYVGIYLDGGPVAEEEKMSSGASNCSLVTGVIPVTPGQTLSVRINQLSGVPLSFTNTARFNVQWF
ncbi:hypothetical protein [Burkholderia phage vB_BpP_HN01]|nr:hypothetical protein [Burkholderia phage vB_BpP_HN01]